MGLLIWFVGEVEERGRAGLLNELPQEDNEAIARQISLVLKQNLYNLTIEEKMISTQTICAELARHNGFISTVELVAELGANTSELRQQLFELGDRVIRNEHDEWRSAAEPIGSTSRMRSHR